MNHYCRFADHSLVHVSVGAGSDWLSCRLEIVTLPPHLFAFSSFFFFFFFFSPPPPCRPPHFFQDTRTSGNDALIRKTEQTTMLLQREWDHEVQALARERSVEDKALYTAKDAELSEVQLAALQRAHHIYCSL